MTDAVTILAQQNRFHSQTKTIHGKYYNKSWGWTIYLGAESRFRMRRVLSKSGLHGCWNNIQVISKEALGNSWGILSAILGHKYHQNHPDTNLQLKSESDHIFIFPCAIALLTLIILDLVSEERRERFRHLSWVEYGYFFSIVHCTCHNWLFLF